MMHCMSRDYIGRDTNTGNTKEDKLFNYGEDKVGWLVIRIWGCVVVDGRASTWLEARKCAVRADAAMATFTD